MRSRVSGFGRATRGRVSAFALVAALGGTFAPAAFGQAAIDEIRGDVVVVTGSTAPTEYEKVGNSLTVVSGELIEDQGYSYVSDVLRQVPGLAINRTGSFGGTTQVRIRGAEGNHTVVLFNGVDVSDAGDGETDLAMLTSANIERIEVLRGPQSGLYGSNALAGVVNVITRTRINGSFANASLEGGSFNTWRASGGAGFGNGDNYLDAAFSAYSTDGFDISELGAFNGSPGRAGDDEGADNATAYLSGGAALSPIFRVDGFARYVNTHGEGDGQDFSGGPNQGLWFDDASEFDTETYNLAGSGTMTLLDGKSVTVLSANYTSSDSFFTDHTPFGDFGSESERTKYALQSSYTFGPTGFLSTLTGFGEVKKEKNDSGSPNERELVGLGVHYAAEIAEQFYLSATFRHDDNDSFEDDDTGGVAASWVLANSGTRLHTSYGTAVTNPSFFEQFGFSPGSFVGNAALQPESAWGWDAGVEQRLGDQLIFDLTYFRSDLEDEIAFGICSLPNPNAPPATLPSSCNQTGTSEREGVEVSATYAPTSDIDIIGSYTWLDATDPSGEPEVRRPENQASLDATWRLPGSKLQLNAGVTYNGGQFDTDFTNFLPTKLDAYTLVRLGASWAVSDRIELYGRVENVTDEDYRENPGVLTAGTAAYVGIRLKEEKSK